MKLCLAPVVMLAAVAMMTGCAASRVKQVAAPAIPSGTTTVSSALTASNLAPAAWDGDSDRIDDAAAIPASTWGSTAQR